MVKSILRKSTKGNRRNKRNHTKRVHFNKYKKVKTFKRNQTIKKRRKTHHKKPKSKHHRAKTVKHTKSNKRHKNNKHHQNKKHRKMLKMKMKGGCAGNLMGQKVTGVPLNPQDYQHPEYTNLNSNVPYPYSGGQKGGSLWDEFGLGDIPIMKNTIINSGKNMISAVTGGDTTSSTNPTVHPAVTNRMDKYPNPIDIHSMHAGSLSSAKSAVATAQTTAAESS
jgi:hypothetical protein